nr:SDR family oxidoreductase [Butyrivibrio sp. AE2032]
MKSRGVEKTYFIGSEFFGKPEDIAEMVMFLCSEKAGFITGENICIDGGMTKLMIYHGDHGWTYEG